MAWNLRARRNRVAVCAVLIGAIAITSAPHAAVPARPTSSSPPEGTIPDLAASGWQPVLDEDFSGTGLDESVWQVTNNHGYTTRGTRTADTVGVSDGNLELTTYTDPSGRTHTSALGTGGLGPLSPTWG